MSSLDPKAEADHSTEVRDRLLGALLANQGLLRSNMALQADVSESHSEFEEALWQLRKTMANIREGRHFTGGSVQP
jgi:hypothetical protein